MTVRVRASELTARGGWLNVDAPLSLAALRGRFVVLDFWPSCCANCLHVIDELRTGTGQSGVAARPVPRCGPRPPWPPRTRAGYCGDAGGHDLVLLDADGTAT